MAELEKYIKIFALDPLEVSKEIGNYPLQSIVPYGPAHQNETAAHTWLKEQRQENKHYIFMPIFMFKEKNNEKD